MQTRQQTRRIQEQKNKEQKNNVSSQPKESTCSPMAIARIQIIEEAMKMTPTTSRDVDTLITISSRSRNLGGLSWLNIAIIYRIFQVLWPIVCNSTTSTQLSEFATEFKRVAAYNLIPSDLDSAYLKAEKQIAAITDEQTKEYALRVFPSKALFVSTVLMLRFNWCEYNNSHK